MTTNPTVPTEPSYKDAKAQAKASKAYAKAQRPFYKKKRYIALGSVAVIAAITAMSGGGGDDEPTAVDQATNGSSSSEKAPKTIEVEAKAILKEFEENEAAADQKYEGKVLQVTGIVDKIDTELFDEDEYIIQIGGGSDFEIFTVNADDQSADAVASLKKGQKITVIGEFEDGGDLGVELSNSKIV